MDSTPESVPLIRAFLAFRLSPEVEDEISKVQAILRELIIAGISWISPEQLHLTLHFFGETREAEIPRLLDRFQHDLSPTGAFTADVKGVGAFPNLRSPRVIWVGLQGAGLFELHARVQGCLVKLGLEPDHRPFSPHVTIGRAKNLTAHRRLTERILSLGQHHLGSSEVRKLILFRSDLTPRGAVHIPLGEIPLQKEG